MTGIESIASSASLGAAADVNRRVLVATLSVIESWMELDGTDIDEASGALRSGPANRARVASTLKNRDGIETLRVLLPGAALAFALNRLDDLGPEKPYPMGSVFKRWEAPEARMHTARHLLKDALEYQLAADAREAKRAAATEHARLEAERAQAEAERAVRARAERDARLQAFREEVNDVLRRDFLGADAWFEGWDTSGEVGVLDFADWKSAFVQAWARDVLADAKLDLEQARAIATTSSHLRVTARAGSGKTRTLVTRALFLQLHCRVDPSSIALVAFNRKAVEEISERISAALPAGSRLPHIVTFHALAYAILKPKQELVFDDADSRTLAQSSKVQVVVDDFIKHRPHEVRRAMLAHFTDEWEFIVRRGLHLDQDEFFAAQNATTRVTLAGEWVKSSGERLIANTLFVNGIDYKYERNHTSGGFNYRPDFTLLVDGKPKVVIEYFGLAGNPRYDAESKKKRDFWRRETRVAFLEFVPDQLIDLGEAGFKRLLLDTVRGVGISISPLTEEEIWERAHDRAVDDFSKTLSAFIGRARQLDLSPDDLHRRTETLGLEAANPHFLRLAADAYDEYLRRARIEGYEDFSGVVWRAAEAIRGGSTAWSRQGGDEQGDLTRLRYIHLDEFQDFSAMFMAFTSAICEQASEAIVCAVGDDWQAINRFAGADLTYFTDFESLFTPSTTQALPTNYRSPSAVVGAGNLVMSGLGEPAISHRAEPGIVEIGHLVDFKPSPAERANFRGDYGTPALLRLIKRGLDDFPQGKVAVLLRRNAVPWYTGAARNTFGSTLDGFQSYLQRHFDEPTGKRIEVSTTHKYKGSEADVVIVAGADRRAYPLIHPTAELFEVFGDTPETLIADERRLFYVATTRAEQSLVYLVTDETTPFLDTIFPQCPHVDWLTLPPAVTAEQAQVEVRVYDAFEIRGTLHGKFGFDFDEVNKTWFATRPAHDFDFEQVRSVLSIIGPRLIEVVDGDGDVIHSAGRRCGG